MAYKLFHASESHLALGELPSRLNSVAWNPGIPEGKTPQRDPGHLNHSPKGDQRDPAIQRT